MKRSSYFSGFLAAAMAVLPGCIHDEPEVMSRTVGIVPATVAANLRGEAEVAGQTLSYAYIGDVIAVAGYGFDADLHANAVTCGTTPCAVLGYRLLSLTDRFGVLYVRLPATLRAGLLRPFRVHVRGRFASPSQTLTVHRLAWGVPASNDVLQAFVPTGAPPVTDATRDIVTRESADGLVLTADAAFAWVVSARELSCVRLADGAVLWRDPTHFAGTVGPIALAPDGRTLAAGVFPQTGGPQISVTDVHGIDASRIGIDPYTGRLRTMGGPIAPRRIGATPTGGPAPGTLAFTPDGRQLLATLSSGVLRRHTIGADGIAWTRDHALPGALPFGLAVTPDGRTALVTDPIAGTLIPFDLANNLAGLPLTAGSVPLGVVMGDGGARVVVAEAGGSALRLYSYSQGGLAVTSPATLPLPGPPGPLAVAPDAHVGAWGTFRGEFGADADTICIVDGNRVGLAYIDHPSGRLHGPTGHVNLAGALKGVVVTPAR